MTRVLGLRTIGAYRQHHTCWVPAHRQKVGKENPDSTYKKTCKTQMNNLYMGSIYSRTTLLITIKFLYPYNEKNYNTAF